MQLTKGKFGSPLLKANDVSAHVTFNGTNASVDSVSLMAKDVDLSLHGDIDLSDPGNVVIRLVSVRPLFVLAPANWLNCVAEVTLAPVSGDEEKGMPVDEIQFFGGLTGRAWMGSLDHKMTAPSSPAPSRDEVRPVQFCAESGRPHTTLVLGVERPAQKSQPRRRSRRH